MNAISLDRLAADNFAGHQRHIHERTDRMFAWLMAVQYVLAIAFALVVSPKTWVGSTQQTHPHVWTAIFLGGVLAGYPIYLAVRHPGAVFTRHIIAISQALFSALLIHLTGGRIETHFHVFGSLAFLAFYRDWRVLISASLIVAADHFVRGVWFPFSVYGVNSAAEWRFLEHAGWVLFEDAFLITACAMGVREMQSMARRQAELQLAKEEIEEARDKVSRQSAILNSVLVGMSDGVVVADANGRFLHFNPAAEQILGRGAQDEPLERWSEFYGLYAEGSDTPYPAHDLPLARAMQGEQVQREELRVKREKLGDEVWLETSAQPLINDEGERSGGVVVFRDVTERRQILHESSQARLEAERANLAKSEFLSRMSHELRTPLNAILGFGQLIQMEQISAEVESLSDGILKGGRHLLQLIDEVLDISRVESGSLSISNEAVQLRRVVADVVDMLTPIADNAGIALTMQDGEGWDDFVIADRQRLAQVLINLVSNAIKYNRPNGDVSIACRREGDGHIAVSVVDSGRGIPAAKLERLFTPFDRLGAEDSEVEGVGLGLALSKRLAEVMGGSLSAHSTDGVGSTFTLALQKAEDPARQEPAPSPTPLAAPSAHARRRLVYIEDNLSNVVVIQKILAHRPDFELHTAATGPEGLDMVRELRPDLVLLDLHLPGLSGQEVFEELRKQRLDVPVVVISADATPRQVSRLLDAGAAAYLTKPIDVAQLLSTLDAVLEPRKAA